MSPFANTANPAGAREAPLFAGLDVSTQSCKLVVIDVEAGTVLHVDRVVYDTDLPEYGTRGGTIPGLGEGVSESDPRMWIAAVESVLDRAREADVPMERVRCLSVSGQQHGLVALSADGTLARPRSKLWNDHDTVEECRILTEAAGGPEAMIREVGNTQRPGYTAPKILHMRRHEPEAYSQATTLFLVHNYVNWYLTGGPGGGVAVMEPGDASGMALWHPGTETWSAAVLAAIDPLLAQKLPPLRPSDETIGSIAPALANRFGLPRDCRIDAGSGDNMYGAIGTGNVAPGILTVSLGTSGTAYTFVREAFVDPQGEIAAFRDATGGHLPLVCVSNLANGYDSLLRTHGLSHQEFDEMVFRAPPGSGGRVILPWFQGERTPDLPQAAPLFLGFGLSDFRPEVLCRAVVEGHVLNLHHGVSRLPGTPGEMRVTGGLSRSPAWLQVLADVFQIDVVRVKGEGAALGAAIHAAWVWLREKGEARSLAHLAQPFVLLDEEGRRRPNPSSTESFSCLRNLYQALVQRILGLGGKGDPFLLRKALTEITPSPPADPHN